MPSKTPKQAKFMRAIAHGWTPDRMESPPSRAVAQEFVEADRKYSGGFAENRYWRGGLAAMDAPNAGYKGRIDWQRGGPITSGDPTIADMSGIDITGPSNAPVTVTGGALLLNKEGGHVNYYQEGGEVRPDHPEGPNPFEGRGMPNAYARWERENHAATPPPPPPTEEPAEPSWWDTLMGYSKGLEATEESLKKLEAEGQAYGGRVGYQTGGLAMAAPAGGVPPWIQPTAPGPGQMPPLESGPGYMPTPTYAEEPQGYQFGGAASRFGPAMRGAGRMMQNYRGVPPQRGRLHPGAQGPRGGGLAAMMRQAQQRRGGLHPGAQGPGGGGFMSRLRQMAEQQRRQQPGPDPHQGRGPVTGGPGLPPRVGEVQAGGGMYTDPTHPNYSPPRPGGGFQIGGGKPMPGPGMIPPAGDEGGGGIPGGPRVPPNMRGYLQRQRMMNRPPANVGGGANRVGMQDQQGGLSRALQRGTGRPPMSRRFGRGRAGPTR